MEPLGEAVQSFGLQCRQYAADTQLCLSLPLKSEEATSSQDQCLVPVMDWMKVNKLKLNLDETEVLLVSRKVDQRTEIRPVLHEVALPLKTQVCLSLIHI